MYQVIIVICAVVCLAACGGEVGGAMADEYVPYPPTQGVREDIDQSSLQLPYLRRAENVVFDKDGALVKREGFKGFIGGDTVERGTSLMTAGDEVIFIDEHSAFSAAKDADTIVKLNRFPKAALKERYSLYRVGSTRDLTVAFADNLLVWAWINDDDEVQVLALDYESETWLVDTVVSTTNDVCTGPRTMTVGSKVAVTWRVDADGEVQGTLVDEGGADAPTVLASDLKAGGQTYDAVQSGTTVAPTLVISYINTSDQLAAAEFDAALSTGDSFTSTGTSFIEAAAWGEPDQSTIWLAGVDSSNDVTVLYLDQNLTQQNKSSGLLSGSDYVTLGKLDTGAVVIGFTLALTVTPTGTFKYQRLSTSGTSGTPKSVTGGRIISAPLWDGEDAYVWVVIATRSTPVNSSYMLLRLTEDGSLNSLTSWPEPELQLAYGQVSDGGPWLGSASAPQHVASVSQKEHVFAAHYDDVATGESRRIVLSGYRVSTEDGRDLTRTELGDTAYGAAGDVRLFDGNRFAELGFYYFPEIWDESSDIAEASGGSLSTGGSYQYALVYEWTDRSGDRHQSAPHITQTQTLTTGNNSFTLDVPPYRFTAKQTLADVAEPVKIVLYRTTEGPTVPFKRVKTTDNDQDSTTDITITDTASDSSISDNEILYATGGILDHVAPPASEIVTAHANRLFGVDSTRPTRIWYTKRHTPFQGLAHNETLQIFVEDTGAPIRGLAAQDGALYALKEDGIYRAAVGEGPDNAGGGVQFPIPSLVSRSAGCDSPASVLEGPDGIYFAGPWEGTRTIFLFPRGEGEPVPIGERVRDTLSSYPVVRRAVHRQNESRIEFAVVDRMPDPTGGRLLYYYYDMRDEEGVGQWVTASIQDGDHAPVDLAISTDTDGSGPTTWVTTHDFGDSQGEFYYIWRQRLSGSHSDQLGNNPASADSYSQVIETGDARPFGPDAWGNIRAVRPRIRYPGDKTTLQIETSYDSGQSYPDDISWALGTTGDVQPSSGDVLELESWGSVQVTDKIRYRITVTTPLQDGEESGVELLNLTLRVAPKRGAQPVAAANRK